MPEYQIEPRDIARAQALEEGATFEGLEILTTPYGSHLLYVNVDDPAQLERLRRDGTLISYRPTKDDYKPRVVEPFPEVETQIRPLAIGDAPPLLFEQPERILEAVRYGEGLTLWLKDTGCIPRHEYFEDKGGFVEGSELVDEHGHGSFIAGQMWSILPRARIMVVRVLDQQGGSGTEVGIIRKLTAARQQFEAMARPDGASNNSWGGGKSRGIEDAFIGLHLAGLPMVNAAGNSGPSATTPTSPTAVARLVAGAYDRANNWLASFSSGGDTVDWVHGYWPGVNEWGVGHRGYNYYNQASGTSMAAPYFTCHIAIMRALHPNWGDAQMLAYLFGRFQALAQRTRNGRGRGWQGVDLLPSTPAPEPPPDETPSELHRLQAQIRLERDVIRDYMNRARYVEWDRDPTFAKTLAGEAVRILEVNLSQNIDALVDEASKKADGGGQPQPEPPPQPTPPPTAPDPRTYLRGWSAPQHWAGSPEGAFAIDWYPAPLGTEFGWVVGGRTRGRADMGPLFLPLGGHDCIVVPNGATVHGPVEFAPNDWREIPQGHVFLPSGTALYTVILDAEDGEMMFAFTHSLQDARLNVGVRMFEKFAKVGDSGLETFTQRGQNPAHIHLAIMRDRSQFGRWQGGQGNVRPWDWLREVGFNVRNEGTVPSPQWYMSGGANKKPY